MTLYFPLFSRSLPAHAPGILEQKIEFLRSQRAQNSNLKQRNDLRLGARFWRVPI